MSHPAVLPLMPSGRPFGWLVGPLWASFGLLYRGDLFNVALNVARPQAPQGSLAALLAGIRRRCFAVLPILLIALSKNSTQQGSCCETINGMFHHHRSRRYRAKLAVPH